MTSPLLIEEDTETDFVISLAVFADNAHTARIDIVDALTLTIIPSSTQASACWTAHLIRSLGSLQTRRIRTIGRRSDIIPFPYR